MEKRIGPFLLSGLMIGPILGSGIIILPPLAFQTAGSMAFYSWCLTALLGIIFARVFAKMTMLLPGDAGVSGAVEMAFGKRARTLAGYYLIGAVLFGPVAVILTASSYLTMFSNTVLTSAVLVICCAFFLLKDAAFLSKISLILSSLAACTLLSGSVLTLAFNFEIQPFRVPNFSFTMLGSTMLLLFWTLVGWEVVGNYSGHVKEPNKTIPRAVNISLLIIITVSLSVAAATQLAGADTNITTIITPLFGRFSPFFMAVLTLSLCVTTYLMFVGGVARLIANFALTGDLPQIFARKTSSGTPIISVLFLTVFFLLVLAAAHLKLLDTTKIVILADGFFLANVLTGLAAAFKLFTSKRTRFMIAVLLAAFTMILMHSSLPVLVLLGFLPILIYRHSILEKLLPRSYNH